jgi:hypothetical protein
LIKTWEVKKPEMEITENYLKAPNFFWSPQMFSLHPTAFKIVQYIVKNTYGWRKNSYSVGVDQIALDCHINRKTASKHLQSLIKDGWVEIVSQADRQNGITRSYKLIHGNIEVDA